MSAISSFSPNNQPVSQPAVITQSGYNPGAPAPQVPSVPTTGQPDKVDLSPAARAVLEAGRIAVDAKSGNLTGSQATQLSAQLSTIGQQISADKQANGGTLTTADAASIFSAQNQFGQQIYADNNAGKTSTSPQTPITSSDARQVFQAGRVALDEQSGKLTSTQAAQLSSQIASTQSTVTADLKASGGTLTASQAQAVTLLQNQLSAQIYQTANPSGVSNPQPVFSATA